MKAANTNNDKYSDRSSPNSNRTEYPSTKLTQQPARSTIPWLLGDQFEDYSHSLILKQEQVLIDPKIETGYDPLDSLQTETGHEKWRRKSSLSRHHSPIPQPPSFQQQLTQQEALNTVNTEILRIKSHIMIRQNESNLEESTSLASTSFAGHENSATFDMDSSLPPTEQSSHPKPDSSASDQSTSTTLDKVHHSSPVPNRISGPIGSPQTSLSIASSPWSSMKTTDVVALDNSDTYTEKKSATDSNDSTISSANNVVPAFNTASIDKISSTTSTSPLDSIATSGALGETTNNDHSINHPSDSANPTSMSNPSSIMTTESPSSPNNIDTVESLNSQGSSSSNISSITATTTANRQPRDYTEKYTQQRDILLKRMEEIKSLWSKADNELKKNEAEQLRLQIYMADMTLPPEDVDVTLDECVPRSWHTLTQLRDQLEIRRQRQQQIQQRKRKQSERDERLKRRDLRRNGIEASPEQQGTPHVELVPTYTTKGSRKFAVHPNFQETSSSRKRAKFNAITDSSIPITNYDFDFPPLDTNSLSPSSTKSTSLNNTSSDILMEKRHQPTTITILDSFIDGVLNTVKLFTRTRHKPVLQSMRPLLETPEMCTLCDVTFPLTSIEVGIQGMMSKFIGSASSSTKLPAVQHDSALLVLMTEGFGKDGHGLNPQLAKALVDLENVAPTDFLDFLMGFKPGDIAAGLDQMEAYCKELMERFKDVELLWLLYTELVICKYGHSTEVVHRSFQGLQQFPHSVYIHWAIIRSAPLYSTRKELTISSLETISSGVKNQLIEEPEVGSRMTAQVLLRILRTDGLQATLEHLVSAATVKQIINFEIETSTLGETLSLDSIPPYIYLTDHDLCYVWMCIVVFYVTWRLPKQFYYTQYWKNGLTAHGAILLPINPLISIHWRPIKKLHLATQEQSVVISMLAAMLKYFVKRTETHPSTKPLLVTVWRTLVSFLDYADSYGHEMLVYRLNKLCPKLLGSSDQPNYFYMNIMQEIDVAHLTGNMIKWRTLMQVDPKYPRLTINYHLQRGAILAYLNGHYLLRYQKHAITSTTVPVKDHLVVAARFSESLIGVYKPYIATKLRSMHCEATPQRVKRYFTLMCDLHTTALGIMDGKYVNQLRDQDFVAADYRRNPFAWMNAIVVFMKHCQVTRDIIPLVNLLSISTSQNVVNDLVTGGPSLLSWFVADCYQFLQSFYCFPSPQLYIQS